MNKLIHTVNEYWDKFELFVGGIFLTLAVFVSVLEIVLRSLFATSMVGADEIAAFAVIWSVFFTASLAVKRNIHVKIDVIFVLLPRSIGRWVDVTGTLLSAVFTVYLIFAGLKLVEESYMLGEITLTMLKLPLWIPHLIIPIGGFLLTIRLIQRAITLIRDKSAYDENPVAVEI